MKLLSMFFALTVALSLPMGVTLAADPEPAPAAASTTKDTQTKAPKPKREYIYGSQLMTRQERIEYHTKMRAAKTAEEREQLRKEHHDAMQERAKTRGITLPDEPPARGGGMGPGMRYDR